MIFKIFIITFAVLFIVRLLLGLSQKKIDATNFLIWILVWGSVIVFTIHPTLADQVAQSIGVARGTDAVFFVAFMIMFYFIFRLYSKITAVESDVTETVKYIALINRKLDRGVKRKKK
ncbi:MAG: DUF2304 domain-containing protein [Patescibacteria group bacterium]|nr:DUF2304 domain-containing protein [Patescibacteria group bacterium]